MIWTNFSPQRIYCKYAPALCSMLDFSAQPDREAALLKGKKG